MPRIRNLAIYVQRRRNLRRLSSSAELDLWDQLKAKQFHGLKFRRQYSIGGYIVDFFCPKLRLAIEVDGDSHFSLAQKSYDAERTKWLASMFIRVIRFSNTEVLEDMEGVLKKLEAFITSQPSSFEEGRIRRINNNRF